MVLVVKNLPANAGDVKDTGSIPVLGRSPGGGHGNPLQYSCLENPMNRGAWWAAVYKITKNQTQLKQLSMQHVQCHIYFLCFLFLWYQFSVLFLYFWFDLFDFFLDKFDLRYISFIYLSKEWALNWCFQGFLSLFMTFLILNLGCCCFSSSYRCMVRLFEIFLLLWSKVVLL